MKRKNLTKAIQIDNSIQQREEFIGDFKESTSMSIWLNID